MSKDLLTEETREINENIQLQNIDDNSTENPIDHGWFENSREIWYRPFEVIDISQPNNIFNEGDNRAIGLSCERENDPTRGNSKFYMKLTKLKYIKMPIKRIINPHITNNYEIDLTPTLNDFEHRFIFKKIEIENHASEEKKDKYTLIYKNYKPEFQEGEERFIKDGYNINEKLIEQEKILQKHKDKLYIKKQERLAKKKNPISGGDQPPPEFDTVVKEILIEEKPADKLQDDDYVLWAISFNDNVTDYIELYDFTKLILEENKILDKKAGPSRNMHLLKLPKDAYTEDEICVYEKRGPTSKPIIEFTTRQTLIHWAIGTYMKVLNTIFGVPLTYMKVMTKAEGGDKVTLEEVEETNVYYNFILTTDTNAGEQFRGIFADGDEGKLSNAQTGSIPLTNIGMNVGADIKSAEAGITFFDNELLDNTISFTKKKSRSINTDWLEGMRNPTIGEDTSDDPAEDITRVFGGKKRKSRKTKKSKKSRKSKKIKRKTTKRKSRKSKR